MDIRNLARVAAGVLMVAVGVIGGPPVNSLRAQEGTQKSEEAQRISTATSAFSEVMSAGDKAIPRAILEKAEAIAVFRRLDRRPSQRGQGPNTLKAAATLATRGLGILSVRGNGGTWSPPAFLTLRGGSRETADLVLVVMNKRGLENVMRRQFPIDAEAAIAGGPVGSDAQPSTEVQRSADILGYSRSRGVLTGDILKGSMLMQDIDANRRFYGKPLTSKQVVAQASAPEPVATWRATLEKYIR